MNCAEKAMMSKQADVIKVKGVNQIRCYHCGQPCSETDPVFDEKRFCCSGCVSVYRLLRENNLGEYYRQEQSPGKPPHEGASGSNLSFLDNPSIRNRLIEYSDGTLARATFKIPAIHCTSCVWLLENLHRMNHAVLESKVDFTRKIFSVTFREDQLSLRQLVSLLGAVGYAPELTLSNLEEKPATSHNRRLLIQTGVAGFAFSNIMLFSFPDYLAQGTLTGTSYQHFFGYLSLLLALPVIGYSAADFFKTAYQGLRHGRTHLDLPIAIGISMLFSRSAYEIVSATGSGYLDSMTGLVFFLLVGRILQNRTYQTLSFDRDYKAYFPLQATRLRGDGTESVSLPDIHIGDVLLFRNGELVVADAVALDEAVMIDYSFVTGEAEPVARHRGDIIYGGGRVVGPSVRLEVIKEVSQGRLVRLWQEEKSGIPARGKITVAAEAVARYFTIGIFVAAAAAFMYWYPQNIGMAVTAATAVLIVACPCALALSIPFTFGTAMQMYGRHGLFLREQRVVEQLAGIDTIIFDKTGTLTGDENSTVEFDGESLTVEEKRQVLALTAHSIHPWSRRINRFLQAGNGMRKDQQVQQFEEIPGQGIRGIVGGHEIRLGSKSWVSSSSESQMPAPDGGRRSSSALSIDGVFRGRFLFGSVYRKEMPDVIRNLQSSYDVRLLSGDNSSEQAHLASIFADEGKLFFNQSPYEKRDFVTSIREERRVLMLGDGLNDAGALAAADVGIAVSDDTTSFSPACHAILMGDSLIRLESFLRFSKRSVKIVLMAFAFSIMYNILGMALAFMGRLSPLVSAILMPVSSISVVFFAVLATRWAARREGL